MFLTSSHWSCFKFLATSQQEKDLRNIFHIKRTCQLLHCVPIQLLTAQNCTRIRLLKGTRTNWKSGGDFVTIITLIQSLVVTLFVTFDAHAFDSGNTSTWRSDGTCRCCTNKWSAQEFSMVSEMFDV